MVRRGPYVGERQNDANMMLLWRRVTSHRWHVVGKIKMTAH